MKSKTNIQQIIVFMLAAVFCLLILAACDKGSDPIASHPTGGSSELTAVPGGETSSRQTVSTEPTASTGQTEPTQRTFADLPVEELIDYLLSELPRAHEMVTEYGMTVLVSGEESEYKSKCRDIWLGTDLDGKFTREILYSICDTGEIFEYNAVLNLWQKVEDVIPKFMAVLRLDKALDNDSYIFLLDDVVWVDDSSEPNGYRIDNDKEEWVPYIASLQTECHVLGPGEESAMELWQVSLDNFVAELNMRGEDMLVEAGIYDGGIYYISEVYHPAPLY